MNSDYWLKYYTVFGKYGYVDEYWDGQKKDTPSLLAEAKTPGGTYRRRPRDGSPAREETS